MNCGCIYNDTGTTASVAFDEVRVTLKPRRCCECRRVISPGEQYERVWGVWEAEKVTHATCQECHEIRRAFMCDFVYGGLWEDLDAAFGYDEGIPWSTVGTLSKPARDLMCDWIESHVWGEDNLLDEGES